MYKKQRPKLSVTAVINSAQNPSANWFAPSPNSCQLNGQLTGLTNHHNAPMTPTNIDLISSNGIYTPNPTSLNQMHSNGSLSNNSSSFDLQQSPNSNVPKYPPNHPLSGSKHLCAICGDRASGRHYGLYSCEGCKGFFKRTVRKDLSYACREDRNCTIDKRQRNRCQFCRYNKCLSMGMKREAVQEERQRNKERNDNEVESSTTMCSPMNSVNANLHSSISASTVTSPASGIAGSNNSSNNFHLEMTAERILSAELKVEQRCRELTEEDHNFNSIIFGNHMLDHNNNHNSRSNAKHLLECYQMIEWAKEIPYFSKLPLEARIALLKSGWNELLIVQFSHRSMHVKDGIQLAAGVTLHRAEAQLANVESIFDRVLIELVAKMSEIQMDKCELGCLRAVVLFNPDAKGLKNSEKVEQLREVVYSTLEKYCRTKYSDQSSRFAKLLLRLPALRSVGLKCTVDYLFISKEWDESKMDSYLKYMLTRSNENYSPMTPHQQSNVMNNNTQMNNNSLMTVNSSMNSINENHHQHLSNQTLLGISTSRLINVIDSNNNLTNGNSSSSFGALGSINFMNSNSMNTMSDLISMNNGTVDASNGLYLPNANNVSNSMNHTNSPLSLS